MLKVVAKLNRSRKPERTFEANISLLRRKVDKEESKDRDSSREDNSFNEKEHSGEEEKEPKSAGNFDECITANMQI